MPPPTLDTLARDLAQGRVTSTQLTAAALARIGDAAGEGARAFIRTDPERALAAARASDALRAAGVARSPLEGIPVSVKDLFDLAGQVTLAGSVALKGAPPAARNAPVVDRLLAAGAVIVGGTNMSEFAFSGLGINPHHGTPRNPWGRAADGGGRIPGGSSSGAAVSVTDGMAALAIGTEAIDRMHSTAQSHNRVMVIELMGHKAGWLALYAGVAGGGDVILLPEIPYDIQAIGRHIENRVNSGKTFSIVVVAEGAISIAEAEMDKNERKKFRAENGPSVAYRVAREIEIETGMETRATVLGYMQRGGTPSASDRVLATSLGTAAVELIAKGKYNRMVALHGDSMGSVDLSIPEGKVKIVPEDHYMIDTALAVGTCLGK